MRRDTRSPASPRFPEVQRQSSLKDSSSRPKSCDVSLLRLAPSVSTARADNSGIYAAQQVGELPGVVTASSLWPLSTLD